MKKNSTALDRKMLKKRHKMTIGYLVFYAVLLALVSMGLSFLLGGIAGTVSFAIPKFIYSSILGMLYLYNMVSLVLMWLFALIFPGPYQFKGLEDNSWNMLYKLNVNPRGLVLNKIRVCVFSNLATYLLGFLLAVGIGFLKSADRAIDVQTILFMALIGILVLLLVIMPTLAVGALTKGKLLLSLSVFLTGAIAAFLLYSCGYFNCASVEDVVASAAKLISLSPLGLLIIPGLALIVFPIVTLTTAVSRARSYNIEELNDDMLKSLGVEDNMLILEEGRNRYNVAISGPDVNDADFDIEVPAMAGAPPVRRPARDEQGLREQAPPQKAKKQKEKPPKKQKKKKRGDDEDDDEYDNDDDFDAVY